MALRLSNDKEKESEFSRRVHNTQGHSQRGERERMSASYKRPIKYKNKIGEIKAAEDLRKSGACILGQCYRI